MSEEEYEEGYELLKSIEGPTKADKMFKELGYEKTIFMQNIKAIVIKYHKEDLEIVFLIRSKMFTTNKILDIKELKAINKKCEELWWLDE